MTKADEPCVEITAGPAPISIYPAQWIVLRRLRHERGWSFRKNFTAVFISFTVGFMITEKCSFISSVEMLFGRAAAVVVTPIRDHDTFDVG
jgi:hypothetical protein